MTSAPISPEEHDELTGASDSRKWEILVAPNMVIGRRWAKELWMMGINIREKDIYTISRPEKFHGARFTKVYLTPMIETSGSIRELMERASALGALRRTCLREGDRFEGFYIISSTGQIYGPSQTL